MAVSPCSRRRRCGVSRCVEGSRLAGQVPAFSSTVWQAEHCSGPSSWIAAPRRATCWTTWRTTWWTTWWATLCTTWTAWCSAVQNMYFMRGCTKQEQQATQFEQQCTDMIPFFQQHRPQVPGQQAAGRKAPDEELLGMHLLSVCARFYRAGGPGRELGRMVAHFRDSLLESLGMIRKVELLDHFDKFMPAKNYAKCPTSQVQKTKYVTANTK